MPHHVRARLLAATTTIALAVGLAGAAGAEPASGRTPPGHSTPPNHSSPPNHSGSVLEARTAAAAQEPPVITAIRVFPRAGFEQRMVGGRIQGSNTGPTEGFTDLATFRRAPAAGRWTRVRPADVSTGYRWVRYLSPNGGVGNIAELQLYSFGERVDGTGFGTPGSWHDRGDTFHKALDGDTTTFFDAPSADGGYVGLDTLGTTPPVPAPGAPGDPGPPPSTGVYRTSGRFLYDPCGDKVTIRGIEAPVIQEHVPGEIASTGANFARVFLHAEPTDHPNTPEHLDSWLARFAELDMAVDVSIATKGGDNPYLRPEWLSVLKKYEHMITIHTFGEAQDIPTEQWVQQSKEWISALRAGGIRAPLFLLSTYGGRDPRPVIEHGQELVDADPERNVVLGVQLYWGFNDSQDTGWYQGWHGYTVEQAIERFATLPFPVVVGINNHDPYGGEWIDYEEQLRLTKQHDIGWFWWDWYNPYDTVGKYHLTFDGRASNPFVVGTGAPNITGITVGSTHYPGQDASLQGWGRDGAGLAYGKHFGDAAEWSGVRGTGGQVDLSITYGNGDDQARPLTVLVNGREVGRFEARPTPDADWQQAWRPRVTETIRVPLADGPNTVRLVADQTEGLHAPNVGEQALVTHPGSVRNTSVRTDYMRTGSCD